MAAERLPSWSGRMPRAFSPIGWCDSRCSIPSARHLYNIIMARPSQCFWQCSTFTNSVCFMAFRFPRALYPPDSQLLWSLVGHSLHPWLIYHHVFPLCTWGFPRLHPFTDSFQHHHHSVGTRCLGEAPKFLLHFLLWPRNIVAILSLCWWYPTGHKLPWAESTSVGHFLGVPSLDPHYGSPSKQMLVGGVKNLCRWLPSFRSATHHFRGAS